MRNREAYIRSNCRKNVDMAVSSHVRHQYVFPPFNTLEAFDEDDGPTSGTYLAHAAQQVSVAVPPIWGSQIFWTITFRARYFSAPYFYVLCYDAVYPLQPSSPVPCGEGGRFI